MGEWVNDRTHGQQFKAQFLRTSAPTSTEGIEKYLSSGMIRGIGPVYARKLVRSFAERVFGVIEAEPDRLREVDGSVIDAAGSVEPLSTSIAIYRVRRVVSKSCREWLSSVRKYTRAARARQHRPTLATPGASCTGNY
jgi:hypothetical protein